jgi:EpsI family protein
MVMATPWLGENVRSFYPEPQRRIVLTAPLGRQGWLGPLPVINDGWQPIYRNASASLQARYNFSSIKDKPSIYLYAAYYYSDRVFSDLLKDNNKIFDPLIWKQENAGVYRVVLENSRSFGVKEVVLRSGAISRVVWYWFFVTGVNTVDLQLAQFLDKVRLISKYSPGCGVLVVSSTFTRNVDEGRDNLKDFLKVMYHPMETLKHPEVTYRSENQGGT